MTTLRVGWWSALRTALAALGFGLCAAANAANITVGAYPELNPAPSITIPADTFLVPVQISGAIRLQSWQFDLLFDNTVVQVVDPLDLSSGIYGAEFVPGSSDTMSFILGGFPLNGLGIVSGVAGSYPSLLTGPSGDGVLAYVLFGFLDGQSTNDPSFRLDNVSIAQDVPEPGTLGMIALSFGLVALRRRGKSSESSPALPVPDRR